MTEAPISQQSVTRRERLQRRGLYAITDRSLCARQGFSDSVEAALRGGAVIVQYRDKSEDRRRRGAEANAVVDLCRRYGALSIINDDINLALESNADGVHLGGKDTTLTHARSVLGTEVLIGISCYNSFASGAAAAADGADYIAFGSFFPSPTKPGAVRATPDLISSTRAVSAIPITAIGGITTEFAPPLIEAGVTHLAVISALFAADDVQASARAFSRIFSHTD